MPRVSDPRREAFGFAIFVATRSASRVKDPRYSAGVAVGEGATVFVVRGWVPAGVALGSGVTVVVGCGVVSSGDTLAVGRGPAGMLGLGSGLAASLGDCASAAPGIAATAASVSAHCNSFVISRVRETAARRM